MAGPLPACLPEVGMTGWLIMADDDDALSMMVMIMPHDQQVMWCVPKKPYVWVEPRGKRRFVKVRE